MSAGAGERGEPTHRRRRGVAVLLSLVLPGLGHLYAGRPGAALGRWLVSAVVAMTTVPSLFSFPLGRATLPLSAVLLVGVYVWIAYDAGRTAEAAPVPYVLRVYNRPRAYIAAFIAAAIAGQLLRGSMRASVATAYRMPSGSMEPTLLIGDYFLASRRATVLAGIGWGSLVVFESSVEPGVEVVKRVVGMPGDTLAMRDGVLLLNGAPVAEPYVMRPDTLADRRDSMMLWLRAYLTSGDPQAYRPSLRDWGPLAVPRDSLFVLGDNRSDSFDSRYFGFLGVGRLRAVPHRIYFSYDRHADRPLPFLTAIRWDRVGRRLDD